jgi:hypothetical protein
MEAEMRTPRRTRSIQTFFSLALVLILCASPALAESVTIFGPKTFIKDKGAPVTYKEQFTTPAGANNFQLVITNGAGEAGEVKNVTITLNGLEIVSSSELRSTGNVQKMLSFTLLPVNEISVTLKGPGGNAVAVQLVGTLAPPDLDGPPTDTNPELPPPPPIIPGF